MKLTNSAWIALFKDLCKIWGVVDDTNYDLRYNPESGQWAIQQLVGDTLTRTPVLVEDGTKFQESCLSGVIPRPWKEVDIYSPVTARRDYLCSMMGYSSTTTRVALIKGTVYFFDRSTKTPLCIQPNPPSWDQVHENQWLDKETS